MAYYQQYSAQKDDGSSYYNSNYSNSYNSSNNQQTQKVNQQFERNNDWYNTPDSSDNSSKSQSTNVNRQCNSRSDYSWNASQTNTNTTSLQTNTSATSLQTYANAAHLDEYGDPKYGQSRYTDHHRPSLASQFRSGQENVEVKLEVRDPGPSKGETGYQQRDWYNNTPSVQCNPPRQQQRVGQHQAPQQGLQKQHSQQLQQQQQQQQLQQQQQQQLQQQQQQLQQQQQQLQQQQQQQQQQSQPSSYLEQFQQQYSSSYQRRSQQQQLQPQQQQRQPQQQQQQQQQRQPQQPTHQEQQSGYIPWRARDDSTYPNSSSAYANKNDGNDSNSNYYNSSNSNENYYYDTNNHSSNSAADPNRRNIRSNNVPPDKRGYIEEPDIRDLEEEALSDFDQLLKTEVERKKRKSDIEDMLIKAGDKFVNDCRKRLENKPCFTGGAPSVGNFYQPPVSSKPSSSSSTSTSVSTLAASSTNSTTLASTHLSALPSASILTSQQVAPTIAPSVVNLQQGGVLGCNNLQQGGVLGSANPVLASPYITNPGFHHPLLQNVFIPGTGGMQRTANLMPRVVQLAPNQLLQPQMPQIVNASGQPTIAALPFQTPAMNQTVARSVQPPADANRSIAAPTTTLSVTTTITTTANTSLQPTSVVASKAVQPAVQPPQQVQQRPPVLNTLVAGGFSANPGPPRFVNLNTTPGTPNFVNLSGTPGVPNVVNLSGTSGLPNVVNLSGTSGLPNVVNLSGTSGLPNVVNLSGSHGLPNVVNLSGTSGLPNVVNLSGTSGLPNVVNLSGTSGMPRIVNLNAAQGPPKIVNLNTTPTAPRIVNLNSTSQAPKVVNLNSNAPVVPANAQRFILVNNKLVPLQSEVSKAVQSITAEVQEEKRQIAEQKRLSKKERAKQNKVVAENEKGEPYLKLVHSSKAWFDYECYEVCTRRKRLIIKMNKQRKAGKEATAEATWKAINELSNSYRRLLRDKKTAFIEGLETAGDIEKICDVTLSGLVDKIVTCERRALIQKRFDRSEGAQRSVMSLMNKEMREKLRKRAEMPEEEDTEDDEFLDPRVGVMGIVSYLRENYIEAEDDVEEQAPVTVSNGLKYSSIQTISGRRLDTDR